ncbi:hypothetical protein M5K25_012644 [Dendrobium thyrsiflorum]|uniref:1-aminocyclopropane-1-carboxylate deaminase n=1 Tax=Dendrobium thyrsiflorum TaxID=117978 RepID=A0ABD0V4J5_DENTH
MRDGYSRSWGTWVSEMSAGCLRLWGVRGSGFVGSSGKAAYALLKDIAANPTKWKGRKILFIHTGGLLGLFDKFEQLAPMIGNWRKMELAESILRKDGIGKMF